MSFSLEAEDGSLTQLTDVTDDLGEASTYLRLGASQDPYVVTATLGDAGPSVEFEVLVTSGFVNSITNMTDSDIFYVREVRPNYLEVLVEDDQGQPVSNTAVTFQVKVIGDNYVSDARVGRQPKFSDANGIARDTLYLGDTAGLLKVIAKSGPLEEDVVDGDSVFYNAAAISGVWGTNQIIPVHSVSGDSIRVLVTQKRNLGQPAEGHPVTFRTKGNGFKFPGGATSMFSSAVFSRAVFVSIIAAFSSFPLRTASRNS